MPMALGADPVATALLAGVALEHDEERGGPGRETIGVADQNGAGQGDAHGNVVVGGLAGRRPLRQRSERPVLSLVLVQEGQRTDDREQLGVVPAVPRGTWPGSPPSKSGMTTGYGNEEALGVARGAAGAAGPARCGRRGPSTLAARRWAAWMARVWAASSSTPSTTRRFSSSGSTSVALVVMTKETGPAIS